MKIVIDGATGRLGTTQHLKALLAIRAEGGVLLKSGDRLMPEPVLLGRNPEKLTALAAKSGGPWSTDRDSCLADKDIAIYFDANATGGRVSRLSAAIAAGKHVYTEKPLAETLDEAVGLARAAQRAGVKNGVVQDKLFLPGLKKLRKLYDSQVFRTHFIGAAGFRLVGVRRGPDPVAAAELELPAGGRGRAILDMFAHWRYVFDRLLGPIEAVSCRHMTAQPDRIDETGAAYKVDVEDHAFAIFELQGGALAQVASSWASRVRRDDLLQIQVDGTEGSAICGLHDCWVQPGIATPRPFFDAEKPQAMDFDDHWQKMPISTRSRIRTAPAGICSCATSPRTGRFRRR